MLLHGGLGDSGDWRRQLADLAEDFTVVAWDAPGAGESDDPPPGFTAAEYAHALAAFVAALGLRRPHVLGLSAGSWFALELWRHHPDLPASFVLASAYAGWAGSLGRAEARRRAQQVLQETGEPPERWLPRWLPTLFTDAAPPDVVEEAAATMARARPTGTRRMIEAFAEADYSDVLPTVAVPALLLHGALDVRSPVRIAEDMAARLPDARVVVLPGVGHMANMEAPQAFDDAVRSFLQQRPVSR